MFTENWFVRNAVVWYLKGWFAKVSEYHKIKQFKNLLIPVDIISGKVRFVGKLPKEDRIILIVCLEVAVFFETVVCK